MNDATVGVKPGPTKLALDFSAQECTCQNITKAGDDLVQLYQQENDYLAEVRVALGKAEADVEMSIHVQGLKMTGLAGYIAAAVAADSNVNALRLKEAKLTARVTGIKASLENVDRAYGLFKTWMQGQRPIGLNER